MHTVTFSTSARANMPVRSLPEVFKPLRSNPSSPPPPPPPPSTGNGFGGDSFSSPPTLASDLPPTVAEGGCCKEASSSDSDSLGLGYPAKGVKEKSCKRLCVLKLLPFKAVPGCGH